MDIHQNITHNPWFELSVVEQLVAIGYDVEKTVQWRDKGDLVESKKSLQNALEFLQLSIDDPKNVNRLSELTKLYDALIDYFMGNNEYSSTDEAWHKYFAYFNHALIQQKGK